MTNKKLSIEKQTDKITKLPKIKYPSKTKNLNKLKSNKTEAKLEALYSKDLTASEQWKKLSALQFHDWQVNFILKRIGKNQDINFLIRCIEWFISQDFSHKQIIRLNVTFGSVANIKIIRSTYSKLIALGFTNEEITSIAGHNYGANNIIAVIGFYKELISFNFYHQQITSMASHINGDKNLEAVYLAYPYLQELFTNAQITNLTSNRYGEKNIDLIVKNLSILSAHVLKSQQIIQYILSLKDPNSSDELLAELNKLREKSGKTQDILTNNLKKSNSISDNANYEQFFSNISLDDKINDKLIDAISNHCEPQPIKKRNEAKNDSSKTLTFSPRTNEINPKKARIHIDQALTPYELKPSQKPKL